MKSLPEKSHSTEFTINMFTVIINNFRGVNYNRSSVTIEATIWSVTRGIIYDHNIVVQASAKQPLLFVLTLGTLSQHIERRDSNSFFHFFRNRSTLLATKRMAGTTLDLMRSFVKF